MADVKITNTTSDLNGATLNNAATEETLKELLAATKGQTKGSRTSRNPLDGLTDNARNASDALDEFSDNLDDVNAETIKNTKSMKALNFASTATTATLNAVGRGLRSVSNTSTDAQGQIEQFGGMVSGALGGAGDAATDAGSAMMGMGKKAGRAGLLIAGAGMALSALATASGAAFAAMSTIIGMAQGFQQTFKAINASGFVLDSSFADLTSNTRAADLTLGQFAGVVERNRTEFSFFAGSVNQGAKRVLALRTAMDQTLVDGFVNMGVSLENIPDALSNYLTLLGRSGRDMQQSDQQAIAGATQLYKQQRLLANLTGKSIEAIQDESLVRTRATRIQATLNEIAEVAPEGRMAFDQAAGIAGMLGDTFKTGFEAMFAGDVTDDTLKAIQAQTPSLYAAFQEVNEGIKSGALGMEEAQIAMYNAIQQAAPGLQAELGQAAQVLRYSGIETPIAALGPDLGLALERLPQIVNGSLDQLKADIDTQFAGGTDGEGGADPMLESFRNVEQGALEVQLALQAIALQITNSIGDETSGVFKSFADGLRTVTDEIITQANKLGGGTGINPEDPTTGIGEGAMSGAIEGASVGAFVGSFFGPLAAAGGAAVGGLLGSLLGAANAYYGNLGGERTLAAEEYVNTANEFAGYSGMANGGVATGPSSGYMMELHGTEAVVPLPDGRSIPVDFSNNMFDSLVSALTNAMSDSSKSMPELVQINKNLLQQNFSLNEKIDRLIRVTEESNNISRNSAYARA